MHDDGCPVLILLCISISNHFCLVSQMAVTEGGETVVLSPDMTRMDPLQGVIRVMPHSLT